jgi:preprotein translocase subunit SecG
VTHGWIIVILVVLIEHGKGTNLKTISNAKHLYKYSY